MITRAFGVAFVGSHPGLVGQVVESMPHPPSLSWVPSTYQSTGQAVRGSDENTADGVFTSLSIPTALDSHRTYVLFSAREYRTPN